MTAAVEMRSRGASSLCSVLVRKTRSWRGMPREEKLWLAPAFLLLGLSRAALLTVPFRRIAPFLGCNMGAVVAVPLADEREVARSLHIGRAVRTASRYTPWQSKCLAQAMAARALLGLCGLPYGLYLGVDKSGSADVVAHAWVCTGRAAVTGGRAFGRYTVVGAFGSPRLGRR